MTVGDSDRRVGLLGRMFTVSGSVRDDYFRGIPEGEYSDPVLTSLRPYVEDSAVCIDVGANIGLYSLALSVLAPNGHIHAFEPSPDAFAYLEKNLAQNGVTNVSVSPLALGSSDQSVRFHEIPFFTAGSFTVDKSCFLTSEILGSNYFEAPCTTLDDFIQTNGLERVDLVKIDVEGGELAVIEGALGMLKKFQPLVLLEFSSFALTLTQSTLPQVALDRICKIFPNVFVVGRDDGLLRRLASGAEIYDFLYDNGIHGPVDNLLGSFSDLMVTRGYVRLATLEAENHAAQQAAERETEGPAQVEVPEPAGQINGSGFAACVARNLASGVRSRLVRARGRKP